LFLSSFLGCSAHNHAELNTNSSKSAENQGIPLLFALPCRIVLAEYLGNFAMFKRICSALIAAFLAVSPVAAEMQFDQTYYFRYKHIAEVSEPTPEGQTKDITAFFIGAVGHPFAEKLPLKPEWQDDNWVITKSTLPAGITFDNKSMMFEGTPTKEVQNAKVELAGHDLNGEEVASAEVTFDLFELVGVQPTVTFYAHTGKYALRQLKVPEGVTVHHWDFVYPTPPGVEIKGRNYDGTPTKAGTYRILIRGYDYLDQPVISYFGKYIVEDGPTFVADVSDQILHLGGPDQQAFFATPSASALLGYSVANTDTPTDKAKVRFALEYENGELFDGITKRPFTGNNDVYLQGWAWSHYQSVKLRYRAIDVDNTPGYSNFFTLGTLGPEATCTPEANASYIPVRITAHNEFVGTGIPVLNGSGTPALGTRVYSIASGVMPDGVRMSDSTGAFSGKPLKEETTEDLMVSVAITNNGVVDSYSCGPYRFLVGPAQAMLTVNSGPFRGHARVGKSFANWSITPGPAEALIPGYTIALDDGQVLPDGVNAQFNGTQMVVSGTPTVVGDYQMKFTFTNGDGRKLPATMNLFVHDDLKINPIPSSVSIKRYDVSDNLMTVPYDAAAVIPGNGPQPNIKVVGSLPAGFSFNNGNPWPGLVQDSNDTLLGGTRLPENRYGPFYYELTDATGEVAKSTDFYIDVTAREPMRAAGTLPVVEFYLGTGLPFAQSRVPLSVWQPPLARDLPVEYTLVPSTLPTDLFWVNSSGTITGFPHEDDRGEHAGYTIKAEDTDLSSVTSDPFVISIEDPLPIKPKHIALQEGNVTVAFVQNGKPEFDPLTLIGTQAEGTFTSASPIPPGLRFNVNDGTFFGTPTEEFRGASVVSYKDKAGRDGSISVNFAIYPKISVSIDPSSFEVGRLAEAKTKNIRPSTVGYYSGATFEPAPSSAQLPQGLIVDPASGQIVGTSPAPEGAVFTDLKIRALHKGHAEFDDTEPFSITIGDQEEFTIDYADTYVYQLVDKTFELSSMPGGLLGPKENGSFTAPIRYFTTSYVPNGLKLTSNGQLTGFPDQLGKWTIKIDALDKDLRPASDTITVFSTLSGFVSIAPGGDEKTVREGESFKTLPQTLDNYVGTAVFSHQPEARPAELDFDTRTGVYEGRINVADYYTWVLAVKDSDERGLHPAAIPKVKVNVVSPVGIAAPTAIKGGKQYSPDPGDKLSISFTRAKNIMGKASYALSGQFPGKLYYKFYAGDEPSGLATYIHYSDNGDTQVVKQLVDELPEQTESRLSPDHLVFDTLALTLKGIPSGEGTFGDLRIGVVDDHMNNYLVMGDPTREVNNSAVSEPFEITVEKADELSISNSADEEHLYQYTSVPTLRTSVHNTAYGLGATWTKLTGSLPKNVYSGGNSTLVYMDYPEEQGSFPNIKWKATDAAGRTINSEPVTLTVGPRLTFQLVASSNPKGMVVFEGDADLTVSAKNAAYGKTIPKNKWTVTGDNNLPPGVGYVIQDGGVHFTGVSTVIGTYSGITVSSEDFLGARASVALTFKVITSSDPIILEVEHLQTKPGFPFTSAQPFTDNTYGAIRFYSNDLASYPQVKLNSTTGVLDGEFAETQRVNFNLFVTDETNRLTSRPVVLEVIPFLRLVVPTQVSFSQGVDANRKIDTFYNIGDVAYRKGAGAWPVGLDVDPLSGNIIGYVDAAVDTYPGLTIVGKDTFGDERESNVFSINIVPIDAAPVISDVVGGITGASISMTMGIDNTFKPTVVDSVKAKAWTYAGTAYALTGALPPGLKFNKDTGVISGIPTTASVTKNLKITVTSLLGDEDTTAAFTLFTIPSDPLAFVEATSPKITLHTGVKKQLSLAVRDFVGEIAFTSSVNAGVAKTAAYGNAARTLDLTLNAEGPGSLTVQVKDEAMRTATKLFDVEGKTLKVALPLLNPEKNVAFTSLAPVVTNPFGNITYSYQGLPPGLTYNANTGVVSGTTTEDSNTYSVTLTITDATDSATATASGTASISDPNGGARYWKVSAVVGGGIAQTTPGKLTPTDIAGVNLLVGNPASVTSNVLWLANKWVSAHPNYMVSGASQETISCMSYTCNLSMQGTNVEYVVDFGKTVNVNKLVLTSLAGDIGGNLWYQGTSKKVAKSADGVNWQDVDMTSSFTTSYYWGQYTIIQTFQKAPK
jgi:uncharacterized membrane protein